MGDKDTNAKGLKTAKELRNAHNWKYLARRHGLGYYELHTDDTGDVPVRLFLTPQLLSDAEDNLYRQIINATRFPGVRLVVLTPDVHYGYGVPVGCVLITSAHNRRYFCAAPLPFFRARNSLSSASSSTSYSGWRRVTRRSLRGRNSSRVRPFR